MQRGAILELDFSAMSLKLNHNETILKPERANNNSKEINEL